MIVDNIKNASIYSGLGDGIRTALDFLQNNDLSDLEIGKHAILGDVCYAVVSDYDTVPQSEKRWEAHRRYIDVQYIVSGSEMMGYAGLDTLNVVEEYDQPNDIIWLKGEGSYIRANQGTFVILFPQDAHMPGVAEAKPESVRKIVVKVAVEK